jgi:hypothetical protein
MICGRDFFCPFSLKGFFRDKKSAPQKRSAGENL